LMYADNVTGSMARAIDETNRRRARQVEFNKEHGITPRTIKKEIRDITEGIRRSEMEIPLEEIGPDADIDALVERLEEEMHLAASSLHFEEAAVIRDRIMEIKKGRK
jgi:excinuclease ABC subunit B